MSNWKHSAGHKRIYSQGEKNQKSFWRRFAPGWIYGSDWFVCANVAVQGLTGEQANWSDGKNHSVGQLVNHIGPHGKELAQGITEGRIDLVNEGMFDMNAPHVYKTTEQAAKAVEENALRLIEVVKKCDDNSWTNKIVPIYWGTNKIFEMPLLGYIGYLPFAWELYALRNFLSPNAGPLRL